MMEAEELRRAIDRLELTQAEAAEALGVGLRTVQRWVAGECAVPGPAAQLVRLWLRHPELRPPAAKRVHAEERGPAE